MRRSPRIGRPLLPLSKAKPTSFRWPSEGPEKEAYKRALPRVAFSPKGMEQPSGLRVPILPVHLGLLHGRQELEDRLGRVRRLLSATFRSQSRSPTPKAEAEPAKLMEVSENAKEKAKKFLLGLSGGLQTWRNSNPLHSWGERTRPSKFFQPHV
ncbi:hypothetical protein LY78DRAFT_675131 [Colletotrichum sublineola]|uniref:Uncharacterized protein n=1 Tax=Colletotrichum sublineola TaxID=1173701 RepID=A0A066XJF9_COLSU|nr:hypothetical protein LY78DRAFT_675131 [Colletotrichum sublineola]KDN69047.1 hypothetical protein CSUB01_11782 [Colletotrichum sublineola]